MTTSEYQKTFIERIHDQGISGREPGPVHRLERRIEGISRRMLTLNLRKLEREGLLVRTVYSTVPPKVEYTRTPMGEALHKTLSALVDWARRHSSDIARARLL